MEKHICTPEKFRFPHYESTCWFAASRLLTDLREMASRGTKVPSFMTSGARSLMTALRHWAGEVSVPYSLIRLKIFNVSHFQTGKGGMEPPPSGVQPMKLFKEFQKEIRTAERQVVALNPPKPERESKRKKKKVVSEDFVDYTDLTSFHSSIEERVGFRKLKVEESSKVIFFLFLIDKIIMLYFYSLELILMALE